MISSPSLPDIESSGKDGILPVVLRPDLAGGLQFYARVDGLEEDVLYEVSVSVLVPADAKLIKLSLTCIGYPSLAYIDADLGKREVWQTISVTTKTPEGAFSIAPGIAAEVEEDCLVWINTFSVRPKLLAKRRSIGREKRNSFRLASLTDIVDGKLGDASKTRVRVIAHLPNTVVPISNLAYGDTVENARYVQWPQNEWSKPDFRFDKAAVYEIDDAVVHGEQGIITVGDILIEESLYMVGWAEAGLHKTGANEFEIESPEPDIVVDQLAHCMCGYVGNRNYAHWWVDIVSTLPIVPHCEAHERALIGLPRIRAKWQRQMLALFPEFAARTIEVGDQTRVAARRLVYAPALNKSDFEPHPRKRDIVDVVRTRAGVSNAAPTRKIYVSRRDAAARPLLNEAEVCDLVARYGFEIVELTGKSVIEQISLFAETGHVISPHGAGLSNILFCRPDTALCELQMASNVQWSIRRIASTSRMRYGLLIGETVSDDMPVDARSWTLDLDKLKRVLDDPAFARNPGERASDSPSSPSPKGQMAKPWYLSWMEDSFS